MKFEMLELDGVKFALLYLAATESVTKFYQIVLCFCDTKLSPDQKKRRKKKITHWKSLAREISLPNDIKKKKKYTDDMKGDEKCFHYAGETFGLISSCSDFFCALYTFPFFVVFERGRLVRKRR